VLLKHVRFNGLFYIASTALLIALAIAFQVKSLQLSHEQYSERARLNAQNLGATLAASIEGSFRNIDITLSAVTDHVRTEKSLKDIDKRVFNATLLELRNRVPSLSSLRVTNAAGEVVFGLEDATKIQSSDREYFQQLKVNPNTGMIISKPVVGRGIRKWMLICARRFNLSNGEFGGVVFAAVELEGMAERLSGKEIKLGGQDVFILFDNDLSIITRYVHGKQDIQAVGKNLPSPDLMKFKMVTEKSRFYVSNSTIDNINRIYYLQKISGQPLGLAIGLSADDAFSGWERESKNAQITTGIFSLVVLVGACLMYNAQMRRLKAVAKLEAAMNFNQKVIDSSAIGIQVCRRDGQCVLVNPALAQMVGGSEQELLQQNFRNLPSWKRCGALDVANKSLLSGATQHLQSEVTTSFGKTIWVQWLFIPFDNQGEQELLVMIRDITDIQHTRKALEESNCRLMQLSKIDGLTGIANRREYDDIGEREWQRALRTQESLAVAMIDIDYFKAYNDHYGHQAGDQCLRAVAQTLAAGLRGGGDFVARYGGEEFIVILSGHDATSAYQVIDRLRRDVEALALIHKGSTCALTVTFSAGIAAAVPQYGSTLSACVALADRNLYEAKRKGRNQIYST